jgi:hypothetical protein
MRLDYRATMRQNEREEQQRNIRTLSANVSNLRQQDVRIVNGQRCIYDNIIRTFRPI